MNLPSQLKQYIKSQSNAAESDHDSLPAELPMGSMKEITDTRQDGVIRATVLMNENHEYLYVLSGTNRLVDLEKIRRVTGINHKPITGDRLDSYVRQNHLKGLPGLLQLDTLNILVDQQLLVNEVVFLEVGGDNQYIQLSQQDFTQLLGDPLVESITAPLTDLEVPVKTQLDEKQLFDSISQFTELRIKQRLEETLELPPLPSTAQRIIKLRVDPNADIGDLASIVEVDPSLAAQVVSWAASPYYSAPGTIKSIHDAIVRVLGFDMVLNLALGLALGKTLNTPKSGSSSLLPYWQQAVHVAATVEALVTLMPRDKRPSFGTAYLAGLLNNFGYLVLMEVFPPHFSTINHHIDANPHITPASIDRHILGISRDQLACWLMEYWNMPESVCTALRHQSDPSYKGDDWEYPLLIFLANNLLRHEGIFTGAPMQPVPESVYQRLQIDPDAAAAAVKNIIESNEELQQIAKDLEGV